MRMLCRLLTNGMSTNKLSFGLLSSAFLYAMCLSFFATAQVKTDTAANSLHCPQRINSEQSISTQEAGWLSSQIAKSHPFLGVSFFVGPLENKVELAPQSETKRGPTTVSTWAIDQSRGPHNLACSYSGTSVVLVKNLPVSIKSCSISSNRRSQRVDARSLTCAS